MFTIYLVCGTKFKFKETKILRMQRNKLMLRISLSVLRDTIKCKLLFLIQLMWQVR